MNVFHFIVWFFNKGASTPEIPEGEPCNEDVLSFITERPVNAQGVITDTLNVESLITDTVNVLSFLTDRPLNVQVTLC